MRDALRQAPGLPILSRDGTDVEIDDDGPGRILYEGSSQSVQTRMRRVLGAMTP